jgi:hypothetical protein
METNVRSTFGWETRQKDAVAFGFGQRRINQLHKGSERGGMSVDFGFGVGIQGQAQFL